MQNRQNRFFNAPGDTTETAKDNQQRIAIVQSAAGMTGSLSLGSSYLGLFLQFLNNPAGAAISGTGALVLYPLLLFSGLVTTALSWIQVAIDRRKKDNKLKNRHV